MSIFLVSVKLYDFKIAGSYRLRYLRLMPNDERLVTLPQEGDSRKDGSNLSYYLI